MTKKRIKPRTVRLAAKPGRGRPPVHQETWSKVSVVLFDRQVLHLDRLAVEIRGRSGKMINRAEIIRSLIDSLIDSGMDAASAVRSRSPRASPAASARRSVESSQGIHPPCDLATDTGRTLMNPGEWT